MGIDGLNKFLKDKHPKVYEEMHISKFAFKKLVFDISSFIYKNMATSGKEWNKWINPFANLFMLFKSFAINTVPIFDGKAPVEKDEERTDRAEQREKGDVKCFQLQLDLARYKTSKVKSELLNETMRKLLLKKHNEQQAAKVKRLIHPSKEEGKNDDLPDDVPIDVDMMEEYLAQREKNIFSILPSDITLLKSFFDKAKIPYLQAPDEAEALACYLANQKMADVVFSLDSDCLAYGVPVIINELDIRTGMCRVLRMERVCEELEMSVEQVRELCILLGTDYNRHTRNISGVGPVNAFKLIQEYETIAAIEDAGKLPRKDREQKDDGLRYERNVQLFSLQYPNIKKVPYWDLNIDFSDLTGFCRDNKIMIDINRLKSLWRPPTITFDDE